MNEKDDIIQLVDFTINNKKSFISCCLKIKNHAILYNFLLKKTSWLDEYEPFLIERLYCLYHNLTDRSKIIRCGKKLKFKNWNEGYNQYCQANCACNIADTSKKRKNLSDDEKQFLIEKTQKTNIAKYGVTHPMKSNVIKEKCKKTFVQKYDSNWPFANETIQEKAQNTIKLKYGNNRQNILKKTVLTNLKKYGVEYPLQNDLILNKTKETLFLKYGVSNTSQKHISQEHLDILLNEDDFKNLIRGKTFREIKKILPIDQTTVAHYCWKYNCRDLIVPDRGSKLEDLIKDFCSSHQISYYQNTHKIIPPMELDFYFPESNSGIECHGLYWHSERAGNKSKDYHYNKWKLCKEKGIDLYQYFEDEITQSFDIIASKILYLNKKHPGRIIGARQLQINWLKNWDDEISFYKNNHVQGHRQDRTHVICARSEIFDICAVMSLRLQKNQLEIVRFATDIRNRYPGVFTKMLEWAVKQLQFQGTVTSWSDNRHSNGGVYARNGFEFVREQLPSYFVTDYETRWRREHFMKNKIKQRHPEVDLSKTEWQLEQELGYDRVWDAGKRFWLKNV
jgi:hypothetical protein